jgi:predicted nuclease of restriction endonuclease-like (RecB) superfamily
MKDDITTLHSTYLHTEDFIADTISMVRSTQTVAYRQVNHILLLRNWFIGKRIAEEELFSNREENYGKEIIKILSRKLTQEFGKGFSERILYSFVQFYKLFPEILQTLSAESSILTWSHYQILFRVHDNTARKWYQQQALEEHWSVRTLDRNVATQYYYRLLQSPIPNKVKEEMMTKTAEYQSDRKLEFIKNPIVAEFLGLSQNTDFLETDLEKAILNNLQKFLLELGKGFAFVARQKHIRTESDDYFIDLVFYNIDLRCYVLIDLKVGKLTHQDVGQMDMYVRMYDEMFKRSTDDPTIGIILCSENNEDVIHYSVLKDKEGSSQPNISHISLLKRNCVLRLKHKRQYTTLNTQKIIRMSEYAIALSTD